ncbi:exonuclease domain-containing protein [Streptomyces iakyrus]|uniref:exonuclease domain-containing protein n=1 Tax=Streptomyces iakyrus TaxID=68219 RepID=UPI0005273EE1|nr:exonuclease domain-containing protein [Streptomyces iakyrus]
MSAPTATSWHRGPLASYDCETNGVDIHTHRIVSAALIHPNGQTTHWLSDLDGAEIPKAASDVRGISTEHARAHGRPAKQVVDQIAHALTGELAGQAALVVMNAPFDLSLLDVECHRHGVATVAERLGTAIAPVVDPLVLDRAADRFRRGKRTLEALAAHYGVPLTDAHTADADAGAALDVACAIAEKFPDLQVPAEVLHGWQVQWHARWAQDFEAHLKQSGKAASIDGSWPLRSIGGKA